MTPGSFDLGTCRKLLRAAAELVARRRERNERKARAPSPSDAFTLAPTAPFAPLAPVEVRAEQFADGQMEQQLERVRAQVALYERVVRVANGRDSTDFTAEELALMAAPDVGIRIVEPGVEVHEIVPVEPWTDRSPPRPPAFIDWLPQPLASQDR